MNGNHDNVRVNRRGPALSVSNNGTFLTPRVPHDDHWEHDHDDHDDHWHHDGKVIVNGDHDKVDIHRREGSMGVVGLVRHVS